MDTLALKRNLPTFVGYWERRRKTRQNRLPKHLRPPSLWPLWAQMGMNTAVIITLFTLILNKDEYLTDWGPGLAIISCLPFVIAGIISGVRMNNRYQKIKGARLAKMNFGLMVAAFLTWAGTIAVYLP